MDNIPLCLAIMFCNGWGLCISYRNMQYMTGDSCEVGRGCVYPLTCGCLRFPLMRVARAGQGCILRYGHSFLQARDLGSRKPQYPVNAANVVVLTHST